MGVDTVFRGGKDLLLSSRGLQNGPFESSWNVIKQIIRWFFGIPRPQKRVVSIIGDMVLLYVAILLAYSLRYDSLYSFTPLQQLSIWLTIIVTIAIFIRIGLYRAVIRFMGYQAMMSVAVGVTLSAGVLVAVSFVLTAHLPRSVPFIYWALAMVFTGGSRMAVRTAISVLSKPRNRKEGVLIYGAGDFGCQLATALSHSAEHSAAAFIDDDESKVGTVVKGLRVYKPAEIGSLLQKHKVQRILLAISNASHVQRSLILRFLEQFPVKVQTIPGMADLVNGRASITEFRDIELEDLLGRDSVPPRLDLIEKNTLGKNVFVSGAGGSIGSELCRQVVLQGANRLVMVDVCEYALYQIEHELRDLVERQGLKTQIIPIVGSVQKEHRMEVILRSFDVEVVYHAAAYKHVPLVEQNVVEGVRNNVFGTWFLAEAAVRAGVRSFVLISTDKAVRPTNIMGASKRMAELVLQAMSERSTVTRFTMVRFGNVLGSSGSVVPLFRRQIKAGGPVTVTHKDIIRYFMTIPEAASLVLQAGAMGTGGEVFLLDMGDPVKIDELACKMIRLMGLAVKDAENPEGIEIVYTGLRHGEKLFEELLVGEGSQETDHPRIMKAREECLDWSNTKSLLSALDRACHHFDCANVRDILLSAPLGYSPEGSCADLVWCKGKDVQLFGDDEPLNLGAQRVAI